MSLNNEPKYIQLKEFIKNYISEGQLKADDKLFSEHELANRFQISRHTVRKAIGELIKSRERVLLLPILKESLKRRASL